MKIDGLVFSTIMVELEAKRIPISDLLSIYVLDDGKVVGMWVRKSWTTVEFIVI